MKTVMTARAQKLLSVFLKVKGPIARDKLYFLADLVPPTNGSEELAMRVVGGRGGIRSYFDVEVDGVLNPLKKDGTAANISGNSLITLVDVKDGVEFVDLTLADTHPLEITEMTRSVMAEYKETFAKEMADRLLNVLIGEEK